MMVVDMWWRVYSAKTLRRMLNDAAEGRAIIMCPMPDDLGAVLTRVARQGCVEAVDVKEAQLHRREWQKRNEEYRADLRARGFVEPEYGQ